MGLQGLAVLMAVWWHGAMSHDFHYSRSDLRYNPTTATWQVTTRVFTDDLEAALQLQKPLDSPLRLGDARELPEADNLLSDWLRMHCLVKDSGQTIPLTYLGKEVDYDITYLYLESPPVAAPRSLWIQWSLMFNLFDDQVNEVALDVHGSEVRELFTLEEPEHHFLP